MSAFDSSAKYYDLLYQNKDYRQEAAYIDSVLSKYSHKKESILEFGCGSGRYSIEFAKLGYQVSGVDLSSEMVSACKTNFEQLPEDIRSKLSVYQGDIRTFELEKKYDFVAALFHVVSYQVTNADLERTFINARNHVDAGGLFVFDCWYGPGVLTDLPETRIKRLQSGKEFLLRIAEPVMHPNENVVDVNYRFLVKDVDSATCNEFTEVHRMRYLFEPEVCMLLQKSGFEFVTSCAWLRNDKPGFDTWYTLFVARAI